ncbi:hypothetical protein IAU59_004941 [Kwoniella sp. CBS 9459]
MSDFVSVPSARASTSTSHIVGAKNASTPSSTVSSTTNQLQRPSISSSSSDEPLIIERPPSYDTGSTHSNAKAGPSRLTATHSADASSNSARTSASAQTSRARTVCATRKGKGALVELDDDEPIFVGSSSNAVLGNLAKKYTFNGSPSLSSKRTSRSITPIPRTVAPGNTDRSRKTSGGSRASSGEIVALEKPAAAESNSRQGSEVVATFTAGQDSDDISRLGSSVTQKKEGKGRTKSVGRDKAKGKGIKGRRKEDVIIDITGSDLTDDSKNLVSTSPAPLPLLPDLALEPAPVPTWLGKTAVLLQLPACAVCKVRFKKTESGAARWRHMSICRPPLYRPPNPPPDLQSLIHTALQALSAPTAPTSLLDLHVRQSDSDSLATPNRDESPVKGSGKKKPGIIGLKSYTNVRASSERGENWDEEVRQRIREFIGPSSPVRGDSASPDPGLPSTLLSPSRGPPDSQGGFELAADPEDEVISHNGNERMVGGDEMPPTQPLGQSSLAQIYGKTGTSLERTPSPSGSPSRSRSPVTPDVHSPISISISLSSTEEVPPPSSQKRTASFRLDDDSDGYGDELDPDDLAERRSIDDEIGDRRFRDPKRPFRRWGDSRVDASLPTSRSTDFNRTLPLGWGGEPILTGAEDDWMVEIIDSPSPEKGRTPRDRIRTERQDTPASATPKAIGKAAAGTVRTHVDTFGSITPTRASVIETVYTVPSSSPEPEDAEAWGDEAVLTWSASREAEVNKRNRDGMDEVWSVDSSDAASVSSVPPSEAGLHEDEDDDDDEGDWGRDAYLTWDAEIDDAEDEDEDDERGEGRIVVAFGDNEQEDADEDLHDHDDGMEDDEEQEVAQQVMEESVSQLVARGMPDYSQWELKKLQKLVVSYGFRTSNDHKSLEKVAIDCWKAVHPLSAPGPVAPPITTTRQARPSAVKSHKKSIVPEPEKAIEVDRSRDSSVSSADVPLAVAKVRGPDRARSGKGKARAVERGDKINVESGDDDDNMTQCRDKDRVTRTGKEKGKKSEEPVDMDKKFYDMIMGDKELWSRILRYEPINFDEMISKSFAAGIDKLSRSWKKELKRYLDLQSVTYFTEDPTGQRRRH